MPIVNDILARKGTEVFSGLLGDTVADAAKLMVEHKVGAVLILEGDRVAGIISERDCTRGVLSSPKPADQVKVEEVMTSNVQCVRQDTTIDECMVLMSKESIRHLPVLEKDKIVGLISASDVLTTVIGEQAEKIKNLETDVLVANSNLRAFL